MTWTAGDAEDFSAVAAQLGKVRQRVAAACASSGRDPSSVCLVAVSKAQSCERIRAAYAAGQRCFAENYVQEWSRKAAELSDLVDLRWRFIGHLQSNKAKVAVQLGASVDSVDSLRLAEVLDRQAAATGCVVEMLLQVNVAGESQKSGCAVAELGAVAVAVAQLPYLRLRGLMTVPPATSDPETSRPHFRRLRELAIDLGLSELSMGMSDDLEVAIAEGATMVRVGTAIFGQRDGRGAES